MQERFRDVLGILQVMGVDISPLTTQWQNAKKNYPTSGIEHERKYAPNGRRKIMALRKLEFQHAILKMCTGRNPKCKLLDNSQNFAGADMCYQYTDGDHNAVMNRVRFGSNRPCQWTVKVRPENKDGTARTLKSANVDYTDLRMFLEEFHRMNNLIPGSEHMLIGQSGEFWFVQDPAGFVIEIVLYKAGRAEPDSTSEPLLLAEIAPWGCPNLDTALDMIKKYEIFLGLGRNRITQSNAELFRDRHAKDT